LYIITKGYRFLQERLVVLVREICGTTCSVSVKIFFAYFFAENKLAGCIGENFDTFAFYWKWLVVGCKPLCIILTSTFNDRKNTNRIMYLVRIHSIGLIKIALKNLPH
jgi:hypothetical protein